MDTRILKYISAIILGAVLVLAGAGMYVSAEEEYYEDEYTEEEEYIPETYYDPIQTNDIPGWPQGQAIQAAAGIVMDIDTGMVLYAKNIYDAHYPASITKIMTCLVALEHCKLSEKITCGEEVYAIEENSSNLGIQPGEIVTMEQALYGLMLESANDLGNAIAVHVAGSIEAFAQMMNEKAAELGCETTHFVNPHGLHNEQHYTCASDMAKIAAAAYDIKKFRKIVSTKEYTIPVTNIVDEERSFLNHHRMMHTDSDYYDSSVTGGKTGYTSDAWNTLVTFAERDGRRLVCVLMRENGAYRSYEETEDLLQYGFSQFKKLQLTDINSFSSPDFYGILKLHYPNEGSLVYQSDLLTAPVVSLLRPEVVTIPAGIDPGMLYRETASDGGRYNVYYEGIRVGTGGLVFYPMPSASQITIPYKQSRDMETLLKSSAEMRQKRQVQQTVDRTVSTIFSALTDARDKAEMFVDENRMTAILIGAFVLAVLLILIIILIMRCTKESRMQRKRRQEEYARMRAADEIERMSAAQIEEELRAAMQQERAKKAREQARKAEMAESERRLRETEQLLEEIRKEHV